MSESTASFRFNSDMPGAQATIREIAQQPQVWRELAAIINVQKTAISEFLQSTLESADARIILTGAGTSAFVGEIAAPALHRSLRMRVDAIATTNLVSNPEAYLSEDVPTLLVSFARSGNSPESVAAARLASSLLKNVRHLVITCSADGLLYEEHHGREDSRVILMPELANDEGFAMTSSFSSMLLAGLLVFREYPSGVVERLAESAQRLFSRRQAHAHELAGRGYRRVVYLGSGPLMGLAQESALKLLELTAGKIVTYFDSALGFRHGPKAVLNHETMVIVYVSHDPYTRQYDLGIIDEIQNSIGSENVVAVSSAILPNRGGEEWALPELDGLDDELLAVVFVSVAQMIGLAFALQLGTTPDNPFPTGSVNRVVTGVEIFPYSRNEEVD